MSAGDAPVRAYRALLVLLPRAIREKDGEEMVETFAETWSDARRRNRRLRLLTGSFGHLLLVAAAERIDHLDAARAAKRKEGGEGTMIQRAFPRDELRQDVAHALRGFARARGFVAASVLTLAVGIGTLIALFRVVNGVLLEPLDYARPERLVIVTSAFLTPENFAGWKERQSALETLVGYSPSAETARLPEGAVPASVHYVSAGFFGLFGERPLEGRLFVPDDHAAGSANVAVVRERFWRERLHGATPSALTLDLEGRVYQVVGVVRDGFRVGYNDRDVWLPLEKESVQGVGAFGRLRVGVSPEAAQQSLTPLAESFATARLRERQRRFGLAPVTVYDAREALVGDTRGTLWTLLGAAAVVLMVACANVATLFLARTVGRRSELAVRAALGAGRGRIVRQLLVEAALLSSAGAALGLVIAGPVTQALLSLAPDYLPRTGELSTDARVVFFAALAAALAVGLFGLLPALFAARGAVVRRSMAARGGTAEPAQLRAQSMLVVAEIAAALVLVTGSGLMLRTYLALNPVDPGFRVRDRVAIWIGLPPAFGPEEQSQFLRRLLGEIERLPGAPAAAATTHLPLTGTTSASPPTAVDGRPSSPEELPTLHWKAVTPGYLELMEVPVVAGRTLLPSDAAGAPRVAVVNETAARTYWRDAPSPIGRTLSIPNGGDEVELTVVGVARDGWSVGDPRPRPELFASFWQLPNDGLRVVVESTRDRPVGETELRRAVARVDPSVAVTRAGTLRSMIERTVVIPRFQATLLGVIAGVALFLAGVGSFAALTYLVRRRTREIAMRMALGASRASVLRLVLLRGVTLTAAGVGLGLALAWASTRVLRAHLYGVSPTDAPTLAASAALLAACALTATLWPAARAMRVDPAEALKQES